MSHTWRLIVLFFLFFFLPGFQQIKAVNGICPKGKVIRSLRTSLFKSDLKLVLPLPIQEKQCSASDVLIGSQATILTSALVLARFCTPLSCQSLYILLAKAPVNCWAEVFENHTQYRATVSEEINPFCQDTIWVITFLHQTKPAQKRLSLTHQNQLKAIHHLMINVLGRKLEIP